MPSAAPDVMPVLMGASTAPLHSKAVSVPLAKYMWARSEAP